MARDDRKRWRTPPERSNARHGPRGANGQLQRVDALERFRAKCRFDPVTGCVVWIGGRTQGRGNSAVYGSFWFDGRREFAHRWAARNIHGLDIDGVTVGHCCPHTPDGHPNTLCVEHLVAQTLAENTAEGNTRRPLRAAQSASQLQFWAFVAKGLEEAPPAHDPASVTADNSIPFFTPPDWLRPAAAPTKEPEQCPF